MSLHLSATTYNLQTRWRAEKRKPICLGCFGDQLSWSGTPLEFAGVSPLLNSAAHYADDGCVGSATTAVVSATVTNVYADHGSVYASTNAIAKAASCEILLSVLCCEVFFVPMGRFLNGVSGGLERSHIGKCGVLEYLDKVECVWSWSKPISGGCRD